MLLVASCGALLGCGGGSASAVVAPSPAVEVVPARVPAPAAPVVESVPQPYDNVIAQPPSERRILGYIPKAYGVLLHVSLTQVESSEFFARHGSELLGDLEPHRQTVISKCNFDPMRGIESVTVGLDLVNMGASGTIVALTTNMGAARLEACVRDLGGKVLNNAFEIDGKTISTFWPSQDVLLMSAEKSSDEMRKELSAGSSLDNPTLMEHLSRTDRHATAWGGGVIPSSVGAMLGGFGGTPVGFVARASLWAGLDVTLEVAFKNDSDAAAMVKMATLGLASSGKASPMRELAESVEVEQVGPIMRIDAQLSPDVAELLFKELN